MIEVSLQHMFFEGIFLLISFVVLGTNTHKKSSANFYERFHRFLLDVFLRDNQVFISRIQLGWSNLYER